MSKGETAALAEGAIMAALAAVIALMGVYLPLLQIATNLLWTVPLVVVTVRRGMRQGVMASVVAALLLIVLVTPVHALLLITQYCGLALAYGYLFRRQTPAGLSVFIGAIVSGVSLFATLVLFSRLLGVSYFSGLEQQLNEVMRQSAELYRQVGFPQQPDEQTMIQTMKLVKLLFPGTLLSVAFFMAALVFFINRRTLERIGLKVVSIPSFREWRLPWYSAWGLILGLALALGGDYWKINGMAVVGKNIIYLYSPLLFFSGAAVIAFFLHRWSLSTFLKGIFLLIAIINLPLTLVLLVTVGAFDPLVNYRRLGRGDGESER